MTAKFPNNKSYAYNFVTNTKAEYSYNENTNQVTTTYSYEVERKAESTANGTIMGILPHQYKNMAQTNYLPYTLNTVRGKMKMLAGSNFTTKLTFSGVLPWLTAVEDTGTLSNCVDVSKKGKKYCVAMFSTITNGRGQDSAWGIYPIP